MSDTNCAKIHWSLWETKGLNTRILQISAGSAREVLRCEPRAYGSSPIKKVQRARGVRRYFLQGGGMLAVCCEDPEYYARENPDRI